MKTDKVRLNVFVERSTAEKIALMGVRFGLNKGETVDWLVRDFLNGGEEKSEPKG